MTLPTHIFGTLDLLFADPPVHHDDKMLAYEFRYESGLVLLAAIVCVQKQGWLGPKPYLYLAIYGGPSHKERLSQDGLPAPKSPTDIQHCYKIVAKLIAMAQVQADALGGGQSLSYSMKPEGK